MSIQITIKQEVGLLNHSNTYGDWGLISITTDLKLVVCVIDNFLRILGFVQLIVVLLILSFFCSVSTTIDGTSNNAHIRHEKIDITINNPK